MRKRVSESNFIEVMDENGAIVFKGLADEYLEENNYDDELADELNTFFGDPDAETIETYNIYNELVFIEKVDVFDIE